MMSPSHQPWLYPHVPAILDGLEEKGVQLAVRWAARGRRWSGAAGATVNRIDCLGVRPLPQLVCAPLQLTTS